MEYSLPLKIAWIFGDRIGYHNSQILEFLLHETTLLSLLLVIYFWMGQRPEAFKRILVSRFLEETDPEVQVKGTEYKQKKKKKLLNSIRIYLVFTNYKQRQRDKIIDPMILNTLLTNHFQLHP